MKFRLLFTDEAKENLKTLEASPAQKEILQAVRKTLGYMETNLRHPSLKTHKYQSLKGPHGEEVFEAYRIFWYYGPEKGTIAIASITPHP